MNPISFRTYQVNPFLENSYVLFDNAGAIVIDPGFSNASEWKPAATFLKEKGLMLQAIVLTHAHIDHILGVNRLQLQFPEIPVFVHQLEKDNWDRAAMAAAYFGIPFEPPVKEPVYFESGTVLFPETFRIKTVFVPGHSPGHVLLQPKEASFVFSGDTVFYRSIGRTDLPGGSYAQLVESITTKIYTLDDDIRLLPGHGPETTVGAEKQENPYVRA